jgi:ribosomal protein S25
MVDVLIANPFVTTIGVADRVNVTFAAAQSAIDQLIRFGMLREVTGRTRSPLYVLADILALMRRER